MDLNIITTGDRQILGNV